jgi:hypothetical protein
MLTVYFDIIKSNGKQTYGELLISPLVSPFYYSGSIVGSETIWLHESGSGVTTPLVPTFYTARLTGLNAETSFLFDLTNVPDGSNITASNYLINYYTSSNNTTASFALYANTAGTASIALGLPDVTDDTSMQYVGINQTSPQATLDVGGDLNVSVDATINRYLYLGNSDNEGIVISENSNGMFLQLDQGGVFALNGGNVGINYTEDTANYTLDVNGDINTSGNYRSNGTILPTSQIIVGSYSNPNSFYTPTFTGSAAMYYQDSGNVLWIWSVNNLVWTQLIG